MYSNNNMYSLRNMIDNRNNEFNRFDGNTNSSIANEKFVPYKIQDENKDLNKKQLYDKHVKKGKEALESFQQEYQIKKQSKEKNNENNIEEKRNEIVKEIKTLTTNFFKQRIIKNKEIIKGIEKKINLQNNITKYENLRNEGHRATLRECSNKYNLFKSINLNDPNLNETDLKCEIFNLPENSESEEIIKNLKGDNSNNESKKNIELSKLYIQRLNELIQGFQSLEPHRIEDKDDYYNILEILEEMKGDGEISKIEGKDVIYTRFGAQIQQLKKDLNEGLKTKIVQNLNKALNKLDNLQPQENNNEDKFKKFFTGEGLDGFYEKFLKKETHILRQVPLKLGNAEVISMDNNMKQKGINEQIEKDQKNIQNLVDLYDVDKKEEKEGDEKDFFDLYNYIFTDINSFKENYEEILKGINKGDTSSLDDNNFKEINMIQKKERYAMYCGFMFYAFKNGKTIDDFEIGNVQGSGNYKSLSDIFIDKVLYLKNEKKGGRKKKRTNKKKKTKKGNKKSKRKTRKVKK